MPQSPDQTFVSACEAPEFREAEALFASWLSRRSPLPTGVLATLPEAAARRGAAFLDLAQRIGLVPAEVVRPALDAAEHRGLLDPAATDLFRRWGCRDRFPIARLRQRLREITLREEHHD